MDASDLLFHHHHGQNQMAAFETLPLHWVDLYKSWGRLSLEEHFQLN